MKGAGRKPVPGTGLHGLDAVLQRLLPGDNVVWQIETTEDYAPFAAPFVTNALAHGKRLIYFRFARHPELVPPGTGAEIHRLWPEVGFETFTAEIHKVIEGAGRGTYYLFDCLSDLAADWYSDLMLGNFFMVTCPYLYELETVTYFALFRDCHSFAAVTSIRDTTQIMIDVFRHGGKFYIHPLKVDKRHSPTMYLPHAWEGDAFPPLTESAILSEVLTQLTAHRVDAVSRTLDMWDRKFLQAREVLEDVQAGVRPEEEVREIFRRLLLMMVTRDDRLAALAEKYLELADLLAIRKRMIGTGLVGGKTVGMLLARAVLCRTDPRWKGLLEVHDSYYVGADVFYTYLVRNHCWRYRRIQRIAGSFREGAEEARERILTGSFPAFILEQFTAMLEYFGQSPIIVRSSSLLEDSFGNAFTGKYDSVFCPNQGSPSARLEAFLAAVQAVYASTMSEEALQYRARRGLLERDEQMAILVQRVSGAVHGGLYFPQAAGVGLSYNPYAWDPRIDPEAGVLRLVFGLGTRAVDRHDDDYTRMVALNDPLRRPESKRGEVVGFAQRNVDVLDLEGNRFASLPVDDVVRQSPELPIDLFATPRGEIRRRAGETSGTGTARGGGWILTFDRLLSETEFVPGMRALLSALRRAYDYPVDVEFTANFLPGGQWRLNLVQCRPLQVREGGNIVEIPEDLDPADVVLDSRGPIIGPSSATTIDRVVYVVPAAYDALPLRERSTIARVIGRLTHIEGENAARTIMLLGPGRWGTSTPSLGVPVSFAEINTVSVICEVVGMGMNIVPDVSLGTHFFNDLVESNMLYLAINPGREENVLRDRFFRASRNRLPDLLPDDAEWTRVVRVVDIPSGTGGRRLHLLANSLRQRAVCYLSPRAGGARAKGDLR